MIRLSLLLFPIALLASALRADDPADAALLTGPAPAPSPEASSLAKVPVSAVEPTPGSKLAGELAKIAKANAAFTSALDPLVARFPCYSAGGTALSGSLSIASSDSLGALLVRASSSFRNIHPDASIDVKQCGSVKGLEELKAGTCEMASISRELSAQERSSIEQATGKKVFTVAIALGAVCVYVNADNPLPGLTKAQCNGIFSITHSMTPEPIIRWNQIDPSSPFGSDPAPLYIERKISGGLQIFQEWCMPGQGFTTINRFVEPGPSSVVNACCAYPTAIGIAGFSHRQPRARALPLSERKGGPFIPPTVETIRNGTYPMRQRMTLVFLMPRDGRIPPLWKNFLRFLLSQDGQDMVAKNALIPVEPASIPPLLGSVSKGRWE